MKNSGIDWIGMIPDDWKVVKLESVVDILDNQRKPVSAGDRKSGEYPYWGAGKIMDYVDDYIFDGEYILLGEDGAPFFDKTRPVAHLVNGKFWANNHIHVLKAKTGVNPTYIVNCLNSVDYKDYIKGAIIPKLNQATMRSIMIPLPPLDQQELIAGYLDEQSRKQSLLKHYDLITQLKNYKTSIISEYVTGKKSLTNTPVTMKDSGIDWIGEIPAHWEVKKIGDVANVFSGKGIKKDEYADDGLYPIIGANGEIGRCNDFNNDHDVITTGRVGTLGTVHRVNKAWISDNTLIVDIKSTIININYLEHYMKCLPYSELRTGTAQPLMTATKIKECWVVVPPLSEQEVIARKLDAVITEVDSVVANSERIVAELKAYKSAVITEFITGQKIVPGFAERERVDSNISWIGSIPSDWKVCKLGDIAKMRQPKTIAKKDMLDDGLYRVFGANGYIGYYNECNYKDDQVAVSCRGANSGVVNYIEGPVYITGNSMVCSIDHRKDIDKKFLLYSLIGMDMTRFVTGSAQPQITQENLSKADVLLPILIEQQAIVTHLDSETSKIDNQIKYYESLVTELQSFKQSIISEAVTGKLTA